MPCTKPSSLLVNQQHIRFDRSGNLVAVEGPLTIQQLILNQLRIPYDQVAKSRMKLAAGQTDVLLNHLGLGDNATFVAITVKYDTNSPEEDNYIQYYYRDNANNLYTIADMQILTGNSKSRIKHLYLNNPNTIYPVYLDIMVGVIDDDALFSYSDEVTPSTGDIVFQNLKYTDIKSWVVGETIAVINENEVPLVYISVEELELVTLQGQQVLINANSSNVITLEFIDAYNAKQAFLLLNWIIEDTSRNTNNYTVVPDTQEPVIYFTTNVFTKFTNPDEWTNPVGSPPYANNSLNDDEFNAYDMSLADNNGVITKSILIDWIVDRVEDNQEGTITLANSDVVIYNLAETETYSYIITAGYYAIKFNLIDIEGNNKVVTVNVQVVAESIDTEGDASPPEEGASPPEEDTDDEITIYKLFYSNSQTTNPTNSAQVRALDSENDIDNSFTLNTGNTNNKFLIALPPGRTIASVSDLDAGGFDITDEYVSQGTVVVSDENNINRNYTLYVMDITIPYSISHRHAMTFSG